MPEGSKHSKAYPAALLLPGDAFDIDQHQVLGRRVAGLSLAKGITAGLEAEEDLTFLVSSPSERQRLIHLLQPQLPQGARLRIVVGLQSEAPMHAGALHVPDPGLARWALLRSGRPANAFSLTGVIHTLCSSSVFDSLERLLTAPLQPWDALVCTSSAGREVVQASLDHHRHALERRFGVALPCPVGPKLPLIPLAVEDPLSSSPQSRQLRRQAARARLSLPDEAFVVLFLGRLSFHSKAHPLPLYRALARLMAERPRAQVHLLECGHLYNTVVAEAYVDLLKDFPQLKLTRIGGLQPASEGEKQLALEAASVFVSPADNLQETFGLSVIEAMAAGLPTVVSDWDGYKDLVDHGVTGLRIPIHAVQSSTDQLDPLDRTYRLGLIDYDTMVGVRSLAAVLDEDAMVQALRLLVDQPDRREAMGVAARQRWQSHYCWSVVARQYRNLWQELASLRRDAGQLQAEPSSTAPMAHLFAHYGTGAFHATRVVRKPYASSPDLLIRPMQKVFSQLICGAAQEALIDHLERSYSVDQADLAALGVPIANQQAVLALLVKLGIAEQQH